MLGSEKRSLHFRTLLVIVVLTDLNEMDSERSIKRKIERVEEKTARLREIILRRFDKIEKTRKLTDAEKVYREGLEKYYITPKKKKED